MLPLIRFVSSVFGLDSQNREVQPSCSETPLEEEKLLEILEEPDEVDVCDAEDPGIEDSENGAECFHTSGTITGIGEIDGIIDGIHRFKLIDAPRNVGLGQTVQYLAFRPSANDSLIVKKVLKVTREVWSDPEDEDEVAKDKFEESRKEKKIFVRHKVCLLSKREGRDVFIDPPGNYSFNLDSVKIPFVPIEGDWLTVVMQVEESEDSLNGCGEILDILEVMALRSKSIEGVISHWKSDKKIGIINRETFFTLDACEIGYVPVVGDEIDAHVIESQQGMLSWRALKVIPAIDRSKHSYNYNESINKISNINDVNSDLLKDKYGVSISKKCNFGKLKFGKEREIILELKNSSEIVHHLTSFGFTNKFQSQMKLMQPEISNRKSIVINCDETLKFVFRCKAKFFGKSSELFVWNFKAFCVGRLITVEVDDEYIEEMKDKRSVRRPRNEINKENLVPTRNGFIIHGVKVLRAAPFVPIKLGMFKVPDYFWNLVVDTVGLYDHRSSDFEVRLLSKVPCLQEVLTPKNYESRWHSLLYLEEVNSVIMLRNHDMTRVLFRKAGDFLVLEVPGVMEKRPSLICGDKVYATNPDPNDSENVIKYEGFIHKIVRNDLYIKFNPTFHNNYDSKDYNVSFCSNRLAFRKCHQAIGVAFKNLTASWLFPTSLKPSAPLFILEEEESTEEGERKEDTNNSGNCSVLQNQNKNNICSINSANLTNGVINGTSVHKTLVGSSSRSNSSASPSHFDSSKLETSTNSSSNICSDRKTLKSSALDTQQSNSSPNLRDSIFNMSQNNRTKTSHDVNSNVSFTRSNLGNINESVSAVKSIPAQIGLASPPRIPVADWLMKNTQVKKRTNLLELLTQEMPSNQEQSSNQDESRNRTAQIRTLEEIEKPLLKSSPPKNMMMLNEIEKPLLDKSLGNGNVMKIEEYNHKKIRWDSEHKAGKVVVNDICEVQPAKKKVCWFNKRLNHFQKEAVRNILKFAARPLPYIIFGPPGTGKTVTLVETALQILALQPESRLLIASPSNSAADCISEKLISTGIFPVGTLVRLCSITYFTDSRCPEILAPYCTTPEFRVVSGDQSFTGEEGLRKSTREALGRHRITVGTCVTLGALYNMGFPQGHFTHVLVDEAGQATEPEILVPLCFLDNKTGQSVLVGDPQQLGPVVFSRHASNLGLKQSLIARLLDTFPYCRDVLSFPETHGFDPRLVTQLVDNYRSLPEILKLPSSMFYEDRLIPHVPEDGLEASILKKLCKELPQRNSLLPPSLVFHGVKGTNFQDDDSPSWFNPQEVVQTLTYVSKLYEYGLTCNDIGIITPYNKQAFKIRQLLTKLDVMLPKVGSVEEFQGQERFVIILSTVRTAGQIDSDANLKSLMGFISSPQRLNVSLTRARALLIILGNPHLLHMDPYWRTVLDYCINNNAYCGCDAPEKRVAKDSPEAVDDDDPLDSEVDK